MILLWVMGALFTLGLHWEDEVAGEDLDWITIFTIFVAILWPFILGMTLYRQLTGQGFSPKENNVVEEEDDA